MIDSKEKYKFDLGVKGVITKSRIGILLYAP